MRRGGNGIAAATKARGSGLVLRGAYAPADVSARRVVRLIFSEETHMNQQHVISLMASSRNEAEWNNNASTVKAACEGYPSF